jgi:hypothetical protein
MNGGTGLRKLKAAIGLRRCPAARTVFACVGTLWFASCTVPAPQVNRGGFASMNETLTVDLARSPAAGPSFGLALGKLLAANASPNASVRVYPGYGRFGQTVGIPTERYVAALGDAEEKAKTLAAHAGMHLGEIQSIAEVYGGQSYGSPYGGAGPHGNELKLLARVTVQGSPDAPIALGVVYGVAGSATRTISVIGLSAATTNGPGPARSNSGWLNVSINSGGKSLADAVANVERYESLVRKAAAQAGIDDAAVVKTDSTFQVN